MQVELEQPYPCLDTIYSLCSVYYPNIRWRSDMLKRWNFLKTGFYEGIKIVHTEGAAVPSTYNYSRIRQANNMTATTLEGRR